MTSTFYGDSAPVHQHYLVEVPAFEGSSHFSVHHFELSEALGEPYRIVVRLSHPQLLQRTDVLGRNAFFKIYADDQLQRSWLGCITALSHVSRSADEHVYTLQIEPHVARLRHREASRVFQRQSAPEIIESILRQHEVLGHEFRFKLRREYPQHAFRLQYRCNDWQYIRVLMEQEGIYCYFVQGDHGDVLVFGDDIDHYIYQPNLELPLREPAGLLPSADSLLSIQTHVQTVPKSFLVADYNPDQAWERFVDEANIAWGDPTTYAQSYVYGTGHLDQAQAKWEAQLRHEAAIAEQVVHQGSGTASCLQPARVLKTDAPLMDTPQGLVITAVTHRGGREQPYQNTFQAIPSNRRFRLPVNGARWPKVVGTLSGRVCSPDKHLYAYINATGYYTVRLDLDFSPWNPGGESTPLRFAKPYAGKLQTGMHFPLQQGTEVIIEFRDGDPNKPYIAGAHHNSHAVDLITSKDAGASRNAINTPAGNSMVMEDQRGHEYVQLTSQHSGVSQLALGDLKGVDRKQRGQGFELRTDGHGALRAARLLLAAEKQAAGSGAQLQADAAKAQLEYALQMVEALAAAADAAQAAAADYEQQKALLDAVLNDLQKAGVLVSAPDGLALTTDAQLQLNAKKQLIATVGEDAQVSALKRITMMAGGMFSVFAQKLGISLKAAAGNVDVKAQAGAINLTGSKGVTIQSADSGVVIEAAERITLRVAGSYLVLTAEGIEDGTRGDRRFRAATYQRLGPSSLPGQMNQWEHADQGEQFVLRWGFDGHPMRNTSFVVEREGKVMLRGCTDGEGNTGLQKSLFTDGVTIRPSAKRDE